MRSEKSSNTQRLALGLIVALHLVWTLLSYDDPLSGQELWKAASASTTGIVAMLPLMLRAARTLRPPRLPWAAAPLAHLPLALLVAAGQLAILLAIRKLARAESWPVTAIWEVRRDVVVYALAITALLVCSSRSRTSY